MGTDKMKMIEGVPSAETTAVTMRSIHELLEEEAAAKAAAMAAGTDTTAPPIPGATLQTPPRIIRPLATQSSPEAGPDVTADRPSDEPAIRGFFKRVLQR